MVDEIPDGEPDPDDFAGKIVHFSESTWDRIDNHYASARAEERADEFASATRESYLQGFTDACQEANTLRVLRSWAEEQRDQAREMYDETGEHEDLVRYHTYVELLIKIAEMGCLPRDDDDP
jgi:hypothetical protein